MSTPGDFDHRVGSRLGDWIQNSADEPLWARPEVRWMVLLLCVLPAIAVVTTPLPLSWQAFFALGTFLLAVWFNRIEGRLISLMMMALSVMVSARYAYWRVTETVNFGNPEWPDLFFAIGLLLAEAYAMLVLLLGYFQVLWPLQRKPAAMPRDPSRWPTVDIYIPTYNEPLKVVRPTILAALEMDWPRDRFNVYVLDDGRRGEFKAFCEEVGATHLTRNDSKHAKAGNLNRAMEKTRGEFVAIFDCDHVPTRSFLQISLGHFLRDERLGMLQTPHHFFSPDPFERNLGTFRQVPNEGELFYGLLQDGNDFWNATFFCGSCAVLRRTALDEVGGIAVETVTEDAHTSLKMHRRGWNTAYINLPQAAGLATESLSAHVGQRIRWARGMAQIFRIDNPFFGKGLKFGQRLCYANAMLHFFYGLPRVVFLTAPLSFLFFEAHVIEAGALTILAYALPHIAHSNLTNSRLQGQYRHSFWAEVYESVLATYILMPTTLALINPKLGTFNVTAKGGLVQQEYFDRDIAKPYLILLVLNLAGVAIAVPRLLVWNTHEIDTVLLNVMWTIYNLVIIGAALSVAWESRQIRRSIRVNTAIRARVRTPDGREIDARTLDISEGGTGLTLEEPLDLALGSRVEVALAPDYRVVWTGATVTRSAGEILAMQFEPLSLEQEKQLVYAIFGRADAWVSWSDRRQRDDMGASFRQILDFGLSGIFRIVGVTTDSVVRDFKSVVNKAMNQIKSKQGQTAALLSAVLIGLLAFSATPVRAQESAAVTPESAPVPLVDPAAATSAGSRTLTLEQLGIERPIRLRGVQGEVAIPVAVRDDELVTRARLNLRYAHSPALIYNLSHLNILLNNELAGTIKFSDLTAQGAEAVVDLDPRLFVEYNQLGLQAVMSYTMDCENPVHSSLWTIVSNLSTLELDTRPIDLANDLNLLPKPFFDERDSRRLTLPFVFAG
ncbi:MAG TPA: UDP-forming cellulose synthase catalytic subunit, partial [Nevskiaceae bacterium]|nr:UDP-forming cellulose synthase catalytic subunit [Nevskiaceae bacterium]